MLVEHIYFYGSTKGRVEGRYRFLSNFYKSPFMVDGREYATVEHYYQSKKHQGTRLEESIRLAPKPMDAKKLAWSWEAPNDWDKKKDEIMLEGIMEKFM